MSAPGAPSWSERLAGLPNTIGMFLAGGLFVVGVLLATVPFDAEVAGTTTECGSPIFELVVPVEQGQTARNVPTAPPCRDEAAQRVLLAAAAVGVAVVGGVAARQIRKRRYDPRRFDLVDARAR